MTTNELAEAAEQATASGHLHPLPGGDYVAAFKHARSWVVAIRLTRSERGAWSPAEMLTRHAGKGPVTAEDYRRLPLGALTNKARALVAKDRAEQAKRDVAVVGHTGKLPIIDIRRARLSAWLVDARHGGTRNDKDYAELAYEYARLGDSGDPSPAKTLAADFGGSPAVWSNRFTEARKRGMLSKSGRGKVSHLTAKAERLTRPL